MARRPAWIWLALVVACGCSIEDLDRPQPQSDPPRTVVAGSGVTVGSGGAGGDGGAGTTSSSSVGGGGGGSTGVGPGALLTPFCGCFEAFNEGTVPACDSCAEGAKVGNCATVWNACQMSANCMSLLNTAMMCNVPYDQTCMDAIALGDPSGVTPLLQFLDCVCNLDCASDCPVAPCQ